jgi:hypothetical protein
MITKRSFTACLLAIASLSWTLAASAATVTTAFVTLADPIATPLSPWLAAALAVAVALIAWSLFRSKGAQRMFLLAAGTVIAAGGLLMPKDSDAGATSPTPLVVSPQVESFSCTSLSVDYISGQVRGVQITSVTAGAGAIIDAGTTCAAGMVLTGQATCHINAHTPPC